MNVMLGISIMCKIIFQLFSNNICIHLLNEKIWKHNRTGQAELTSKKNTDSQDWAKVKLKKGRKNIS